MRLFFFNCLLLASVAVALPNRPHKRDLPYLKNLITSAIFGRNQINIQPTSVLQEENGHKLFRLPGDDDVIIKIAPKKTVLEEFVYPPAEEKDKDNAFGTVVGTKSADDALVAVKEVDNLLSTGILYRGHNNVMPETVVPMFPSLNPPNNYVVEEKIKTVPVIETRPALKEVIESGPVITEVIENTPVLIEVIRPVEEKVGPFELTYSYIKIQNNVPVMTYTVHNNLGVEVLETIRIKTKLPMCIKKRVDEAIVLSADPNRFAPVQEVFQYQSPPVVDFSYSRVQSNSSVQNSFCEEVGPVQEIFKYQSPLVFELSYPRVEVNLYVQNSSREEVLTEGFGTEADHEVPPQMLDSLKDSPAHNNLKPEKEDISASKDKDNSETKKVQAFNNLGKKVNASQTLAEYIANLSNKDGTPVVSKRKMKKMKAVPLVGSKDNVCNEKIPVNG